MTLVIMAAGMGSRFGGLKQIEPMNENNEFLIDYSIYDAIKVGFTKVVFIIKRENFETFKETIGKRIEKEITVEYAFQDLTDLPIGFNLPQERIKPWGTAHAILCAKNCVNEPFVIINADDFYGRESYEEVAKFIKNIDSEKLACAMVAYKLKNTVTENGAVKRAICKIENNKLVELIESNITKEDGKYIAHRLDLEQDFEVSEEALVSMNMFVFTPKIFKYLEEEFVKFLNENKYNYTKEFLIPDVVCKLIKNNLTDVKILNTNAKWLGITYKLDKENVVNELKKLHESKIYEEKLWK